MGSPPSIMPDYDRPTRRAESEALARNPAALLERLTKLEGERAVDAARIAVLEAEMRELRREVRA